MHYVFIHGLGQNAASWKETLSSLNIQGSTPCPDLFSLLNRKDATYENLYKSFSDYCDSIDEPLNLCGLSLGGICALNYAVDNPSKVKSLVLIAAQYKMPKVLLKLQNFIFRFISDSSFTDMGMSKNDFITLTNSMMSLNFDAALKNISMPVLVLCGAKDKANKKAAESLSANIPNAKLLFVTNANHEVNKDAPKELAEILNDFYKI